MSNQSQLTDQQFKDNLTYIQSQIATCSCIIIILLGITTNILNVLICSRKKIRKESLGFYSPLMSILNILSLIFGLFIVYPPLSEVLLISTLTCVIFSYLSRITLHTNSWLYVLASLDRTLCIINPLKFRFIKNKKNLSILVLALTVIICLLDSPNFFYSVKLNQVNASLVIKRCTAPSEIVLIRDLLAQLMRTIFPVVLEFILNSILIYKLIKSRRNANVQRSLHRDYKFAFTIVILNLMFLITHLPLLVVVVYLNVLNNQNIILYNTNNLIVANFLLTITTLFASYMTLSVFFVNLICNRFFKMELFSAFNEGVLLVRLLKRRVCDFKIFKLVRAKEILMTKKNYVLTNSSLNSKISQPVLIKFTNHIQDSSTLDSFQPTTKIMI